MTTVTNLKGGLLRCVGQQQQSQNELFFEQIQISSSLVINLLQLRSSSPSSHLHSYATVFFSFKEAYQLAHEGLVSSTVRNRRVTEIIHIQILLVASCTFGCDCCAYLVSVTKADSKFHLSPIKSMLSRVS